MNKVRSFRTGLGYSQEDMAKALDISTTAYRYKENGDKPFTQDEMIKFLNEVKKTDKTATLDIIFLK